MKINRRWLLAVVASAAFSSSPSLFAEGNVMFSSYSGVNRSSYIFLGGVHAFNGDLYRDGFMLRVTGGYGAYNYLTPAVPGGVVRGKSNEVDLMLGYQVFWNKRNFVTLYGGEDYQRHRLNFADASNPVQGERASLKAQLEGNAGFTEKTGLSAMGSYSDVFKSYWTRIRPGYDLNWFTIGPEALFMGSKSYDQKFVGGYIGNVWLGKSVRSGLSVGYSHSNRNKLDSPYGTIEAAAYF